MADWVRELPIHIEALKGEFMKTRPPRMRM